MPLMVRCPLCRKPTPYQGNPFRPFCSERCQVNDQANWAEEKYTLPTQDGPSEEGEE
ncbi:MAG: DNA gyrase inhibitor YacG [Deltaproteobacteria bacterium]|nr:DNA gyrase inhibitor YacG [Deltaproteobacteria bacterium]